LEHSDSKDISKREASINLGKYGLPLKVKFCTRCFISGQRPSSAVVFRASAADLKSTIAFSEEGICEACLVHESKELETGWNSREKELI